MNKRLAAGAIAALSTAGLLAIPAAPAAAAECAAVTYGSNGYSLRNYPRAAYVRANTTITVRGTLTRGGRGCVGATLNFYTNTNRDTTYRLTNRAVTDFSANAFVRYTIREPSTSIWTYGANGRTVARSFIARYHVVG